MANVKKACLLCVAVVWIFCFGLMTGTFTMRYKAKKLFEPSTEAYVTVTSSENTSSESESTTRQGIQISMVTDPTLPVSESVSSFSGGSVLESVTGTTGSYIPEERDEIVNSLIYAINATKETGSFTVIKSQTFSIIKDGFTGGNLAATTFDSIIKDISEKPPQTRTYTGDKKKEGDPNDFIPPVSKKASILYTSLKSWASGRNSGDDGYTVKIEYNDEVRSLDSVGGGMSGVFDFPTSSSFKLPEGVYLSGLDLMIMGGTVTADINSEGKLESIKYILPISSGKCSASVAGVSASVNFHGEYTCTLNFSYR